MERHDSSMNEFYVSSSGDDNAPGTKDRPFATLNRAQAAAREASGNVAICLRAGTHFITRTIELTEDDSSKCGHRIVYQAFGYGTAHKEDVVISGGRVITGWEERDGVWIAEVGDLDTRQLYVDGRKVKRAGIAGLPSEVRRTATGYVVDNSAPLNWDAPSSVEFVFRGIYPWTEARCGVAAISNNPNFTVVTMAQPAFAQANEFYNSAWGGQVKSGPGFPTRVENDPSFLTEPGTFALDRSRRNHHVLHYLPLPGEDQSHTHVVAPALEELLRATNTHDISFMGLGFADATWLQPHSGFLHYHSNVFYDGSGGIDKVIIGEDQSWVTVATKSAKIPSCISLNETTGMRFEGCHFARLGATALGAYGGAGLELLDCHFDSLAASAVMVSGSRNTLIKNNLIENVGLDYSGSPGIALFDTVDCTISHNHITKTSHCGIAAGPGRSTHIAHNFITHTMGVLADGGGIYIAGVQGDSDDNGAVIRGNVIEDTLTPYNFGLYTDYGAEWITIQDNVVIRADNTAILHVIPPLKNVTYRGNFWDISPVGSNNVPKGVTFEDNSTLADEHALSAATTAIRASCGPTPTSFP